MNCNVSSPLKAVWRQELNTVTGKLQLGSCVCDGLSVIPIWKTKGSGCVLYGIMLHYYKINSTMSQRSEKRGKYMIELSVLEQRYPCRTKEYLWYKETCQAVEMIVNEQKTLAEIKCLSEQENIFNAATISRANEIRIVVARRIRAVNNLFLCKFLSLDIQMQKLFCIVMVMLTDRMFFEFMDFVYREKLITNCPVLRDSDIIGYIHSIQDHEDYASKWTDAGIRKVRDNYKSILKEAGLISDNRINGTERKIIKPIIKSEVREFLIAEGIGRIEKILAGERG